MPWSGVDDQGKIFTASMANRLPSMMPVKSKLIIMVTAPATFAPGFASADLNGDGKNDLVVADTYGYLWFFSETPARR